LEAEDEGVEEAEDEDVEEVESNVNRDAEGIWERLQACGLVPETFDFSEYSKSDENIAKQSQRVTFYVAYKLQQNLYRKRATMMMMAAIPWKPC